MKNKGSTTQGMYEEKQEEAEEVADLHDEDTISLDEFDEFDKKQDIPNSSSSNDGGIYPAEEAFDQDSPNYEAGTPGHPGIDEGTA